MRKYARPARGRQVTKSEYGNNKSNKNSNNKIVSDAEHSKSLESEIEGLVNDLLFIGKEEENAPGKRKKYRKKKGDTRRPRRNLERKHNARNVQKILGSGSESKSTFSGKDHMCGLSSRYVSDSDDYSTSDSDSLDLYSSVPCGATPVTPDAKPKDNRRRQKRPAQKQRRGREPYRSICNSSSSESDFSNGNSNRLTPMCVDATPKQSGRTAKNTNSRTTQRTFSFRSDSEKSMSKPPRSTCDALSQIEYYTIFNKVKQQAGSNSKLFWSYMDDGVKASRTILNSSITKNRSEIVNGISSINKDVGVATAKLIDSFCLISDCVEADAVEPESFLDQEKSRCNELNNGSIALHDFLLSAAHFKHLAVGAEVDESNIDSNKDIKFITVTLALPVGRNASLLKGNTTEIGDQLISINNMSTYKKSANDVYAILPSTSLDQKDVQLTFLRFIGEVKEVNTYYSDPDPSIQQIKSDDENNFSDIGIDTEKEDYTASSKPEAEKSLNNIHETLPEFKDIIVQVKSTQFKNNAEETHKTNEIISYNSGIALDEYVPQAVEETSMHEDQSIADSKVAPLEQNDQTEHESQFDVEQEKNDEITLTNSTESTHSTESFHDSITLPLPQATPQPECMEEEVSIKEDDIPSPPKKKGLKKKLFSLLKRKKKK